MFRARLQCSDEAVGCILKARGKKKTEKLDESGINNPVLMVHHNYSASG